MSGSRETMLAYLGRVNMTYVMDIAWHLLRY